MMIPSISPAAPTVNNSGVFHSNSGRGGSVRNTHHSIYCHTYTLCFLFNKLSFHICSYCVMAATLVCQSPLSYSSHKSWASGSRRAPPYRRSSFSSFGSVLQLSVNLVVPVSVRHLLSRGHVRSHHYTVQRTL